MKKLELNLNVLALATLFVIFDFIVPSAVGQDAEIELSLEADSAHFSELLEKLGSEQFDEREGASRRLLELPVSTLPWVEEKLQQLKGNANLERRIRLGFLLEVLDERCPGLLSA